MLRTIAVCLLLLSCGAAQEPQFPNSRKGFEKQFEQVYKAFKSSDDKAFNTAVLSFGLPYRWFDETFSPEDAALLRDQYKEQFGRYRVSVRSKLNFFGSKPATSIEVADGHMISDLNPPPAPPPQTLQPLPEIKPFDITYRLYGGYVIIGGEKARQSSWMDLFVYVDGAFRYFGSGARPFWTPLNMYPSDPCTSVAAGTKREVPTEMRPAFVDSSTGKSFEGRVRALVLVAVDGSAKDVTITRGDPPLAEAAKQVIKEMKFVPFANCGKAIEGRRMQYVEFKGTK